MTTMDRRRFLEMAGAAGLAVGTLGGLNWARAGGGFGQAPRHALEPYDGPLFVMVQAFGGWEPTLLCDPHANLNNSYTEDQIGQIGNIRYAPIPGAAEFFGAHAHHMTVINGVDTQTNSHDPGRRNCVSGRLADGYPNIAALLAAANAQHLPMSFLTFGGYEETAGTIAPTRDGNQDRLMELAYPDRINPMDELSPSYHSAAAKDIIAAAREERTTKLRQNQYLPRYQNSLDMVVTAREGKEELGQFYELLPEPDANPQFQRIQLAVAAYASGVASSANFAVDGFDTHSNHDATHTPRLSEMIGLVQFLFEEAERQGVADRVVAVMASDFGRTPNYNGGAGKDHWSITSMVALGDPIPGDRTVGLTDDGHNPIPLDPVTLLPADDPEEGVHIQPAHVHQALRKMFGVEGTTLDNQFPIRTDEELPIFG